MKREIQVTFNLSYEDMTIDRVTDLARIIEKAIEDRPTVVSDLLLPVVKEYEKANFIPEGAMLPQDWGYDITVNNFTISRLVV